MIIVLVVDSQLQCMYYILREEVTPTKHTIYNRHHLMHPAKQNLLLATTVLNPPSKPNINPTQYILLEYILNQQKPHEIKHDRYPSLLTNQ